MTGDFRILKVRELVMKGPSYREQNNNNWELNLKLCIEECGMKWADVAKVDRRVLKEWEKVVLECSTNRITVLKKKYVHI